MKLHPEVEALLGAMRGLQRHLEGLDDFGADHVRRAGDEVAASDAHGLQRFLGFFGGMGSLNELVLWRDGAPLGAENDRLEALRDEAWSLAHALRRELI